MRPQTAICLTLGVENIAHLFNYLIQVGLDDESINAPTHYAQQRPLFRQIRDWLEARMLLDVDEPEDIDSNALFYIEAAIAEILAQLEELVGENLEFIAVVPFDARGNVVVVLTLK